MRTILICYEERPVAGRVLERAAELAKTFGAKVIVTSVAPVIGVSPRGTTRIDLADPPERHAEELRDAAARLAESGVEDVEDVTGIGDPAHKILELADERDVDLIVLGAHDGGALSRFFKGSPGDTVLHKAHTDVLVVA